MKTLRFEILVEVEDQFVPDGDDLAEVCADLNTLALDILEDDFNVDVSSTECMVTVETTVPKETVIVYREPQEDQ